MEITKRLIEFILSGILIILSLTFLFYCIFPKEVHSLLDQAEKSTSYIFNNATLATALFTAISYAVGLVSENMVQNLFEGLLDKTKHNQINDFLKRSFTAIKDTPVIKAFSLDTDEPIDKETAGRLYGEMRVYVNLKSQQLYTEIESQINRFRILRVMFLSEALIITGLVILTFRSYSWCKVFYVLMACLAALFTYIAINNRFYRYCRAIERAYKIVSLSNTDVKTD